MTELGFTAKDRMDKMDGHNLWAGVTTGLRVPRDLYTI